MVPGSHLWDSKRRPTMEEAVPMVGKAGTVLYVSYLKSLIEWKHDRTALTEYSYFLGTTWHCGGPNMTDKPRRAATIQYCQPYVCFLDLTSKSRRILTA